MHILIAGGASSIGSHKAEALAEPGMMSIVFDDAIFMRATGGWHPACRDVRHAIAPALAWDWRKRRAPMLAGAELELTSISARHD